MAVIMLGAAGWVETEDDGSFRMSLRGPMSAQCRRKTRSAWDGGCWTGPAHHALRMKETIARSRDDPATINRRGGEFAHRLKWRPLCPPTVQQERMFSYSLPMPQ